MREKELEIVFVRHAQSFANIGMGAAGFHEDDPPLTEEGLRQARLLAARFERGDLQAIYASTLIRTCQTVQPTAQKLDLPICVLPDLMERETVIPGTSLAAVASLAPNALDSARTVFPANAAYSLRDETVLTSVARAKRALDRICGECAPGGAVLVASHGAFFGYLIREALGLRLPEPFAWEVGNCAVTRVRFRPGNVPILMCSNDCGHLI